MKFGITNWLIILTVETCGQLIEHRSSSNSSPYDWGYFYGRLKSPLEG